MGGVTTNQPALTLPLHDHDDHDHDDDDDGDDDDEAQRIGPNFRPHWCHRGSRGSARDEI